MVSPNYAEIFVCKLSTDIKKHYHLRLNRLKNSVLDGPFGGRGGGGVSNYVNYVKYTPNYVKTFVC